MARKTTLPEAPDEIIMDLEPDPCNEGSNGKPPAKGVRFIADVNRKRSLIQMRGAIRLRGNLGS